MPLWRARTLRDLARELAGSGERAAAERARAEALAGFRAHGSREAREPPPVW